MGNRTFNRIWRAGCTAVAVLFLLLSAGCSLQQDTQPPQAVSLFVTSAEITVGGQFLLSVNSDTENIEWFSSNDDIATVDGGKVTGVSAGTAVITASDGRTLSNCRVTVKPVVLGVKITLSDATVAVGDSITLSTSVSEEYEVVWTTSDPLVAMVEDGTVTAVGAGRAEITAIVEQVTASCTITVIQVDSGKTDPEEEPREPGRQLIWSDEFDGDTLDESKWEYQLGVQDVYVNNGQTTYGPWFWGNNEQQYYTRDAVSVSNGVLRITAARAEGLPNDRGFTSARITTRDRGFWTYGYFEARMKLPVGTGMWPAFWMLPQPEAGMGTNNKYGGWAANGEIDIMEAKGRLPYETSGTLHYGGNPSTYNYRNAKLILPMSEWHIYGFEWRADHMSWYVDGTEFFRLSCTSWRTDSALGKDNPTAPFDEPFYLLLNLAVGGNFDGGNMPADDFVSAEMIIDYVRVYA